MPDAPVQATEPPLHRVWLCPPGQFGATTAEGEHRAGQGRDAVQDPDTWQWTEDDAELAKSGIPRAMLVDLVLPGHVLGEVTDAAARHTGIPAGIPVVDTANDKAVEALGCGLRTPDTLLVSLGTYVAGMATGPRNVRDATAFWTNYASLPHSYLYESGGVRRGMWTVSWYRDLLGEEAATRAREAGLDIEDYLNSEAAKVPPGSEGLLTVLDRLAPGDAPFRKGTIPGFDGGRTTSSAEDGIAARRCSRR
ncbi:hypothetical protein ABZ916_10475 [Streptomyces sp. NPDC046853]|uniref:hypothetical protein n=1 Tax=Streptomyces sp. NPDC046853 TaxID=3154920 RepID=UPI0033EDD197